MDINLLCGSWTKSSKVRTKLIQLSTTPFPQKSEGISDDI